MIYLQKCLYEFEYRLLKLRYRDSKPIIAYRDYSTDGFGVKKHGGFPFVPCHMPTSNMLTNAKVMG